MTAATLDNPALGALRHINHMLTDPTLHKQCLTYTEREREREREGERERQTERERRKGERKKKGREEGRMKGEK